MESPKCQLQTTPLDRGQTIKEVFLKPHQPLFIQELPQEFRFCNTKLRDENGKTITTFWIDQHVKKGLEIEKGKIEKIEERRD
ncbi:hypothetical protein [Bacillus sp. FSL K6-3431]|uniref:hypothetical protein n=1 Tax=Bacillus sp. FSL K6-3431 TaxID=2921500 RepID=UPI0030F52182